MRLPLALLLLALSMNTSARTYYVNKSAFGANDGSTWANAFRNLRWALGVAGRGDSIKVATGTYIPSSVQYVDSTFIIPKGIVLLGGYPSTGNPTDAQRDWINSPTILSNTGYSGTLASAANIDTLTVIDGFQITAGYPAIQITNSNGLAFRNTLFQQNAEWAVNIDSSRVVFTDCVFDRSSGEDVVLTNSADCAFYNCVFSAGPSDSYAINSQNASFTLTNCTLVNYTSAAVYASGAGVATIRNCIFWNNRSNPSVGNADIQSGGETIVIGNCLTQTYYQDSVSTLQVSNNPRFYNFLNPAGADDKWFTADDGLQLMAPCSPGLNTGDNSAVAGIATDILGRPRVFNGGTVDLGAYELQSTPGSPATTVYVNGLATGAGNGSSWSDAFPTLQQALLYCADTIKVAAGVYLTPNSLHDSIFFLENKKVILGGYPATGNPTDAQRNPLLNQTLLKGYYPAGGLYTNSAVLQAFHCDSTTLIDGFAFDNEEDNNNSGSQPSLNIAYGSNPRVNNCQFFVVNNNNQGGGGIQISQNSRPLITNSSFSTDASTYSGGAIACASNSSPTIRNCQFSGITNYGPTYRGTGFALLFDQCTGIVDSCTFQRASSNATAPVVDIVASNIRFSNCLFRSVVSGGYLLYNSGNSTGVFDNCVFKNISNNAIYNDNSSPVFNHCLFDSNAVTLTNVNYSAPVFNNCVSLNGAFLQNTRSFPVVNNSTIINTYGYDYTPNPAQEELITNNDSSLLRANNSIFWGTKLIQGHRDISDTPTTTGAKQSASILTNCLTRGYGTDKVNGNRVGVNPRFYRLTDLYGPDKLPFTADDGIRLAACSPAIDAGNSTAGTILQTDILGAPRFFGAAIDVGAYEYQQTPNYANSFYVRPTATGLNNGRNWQDAYTSLQTAVCDVCGDTLRIAAGTYFPAATDRDSSFDFQRDFTLLGGYPPGGGSDAQRDPFTNLTILNGNIGNPADSTDNTKNIITIEGVPDSVIIDGLVLTNGSATVHGIVLGNSGGSALYIYNSTGNIRNCQFINNSGSLTGGAIDYYYSTLTITRSVFSYNSAEDYGGALACSSAGFLHLDGCIFDHNSAYGRGGALQAWGGFDIKNCLFYKNFTTSVTNAAGTGGAIDASMGYGAITNCTFVGNSAAYKYASGGGISLNNSYGGLGVPIQNCIFWQNSSGGSTTASGADISGVNYNTVFNCLVQVARYGNNAVLYPNFIDTTNPRGKDGKWFTADDGLQVVYGSPAIDYGNNSYIAGFFSDLAEGKRIVGASVDAGAYEFQDQPLALAGNDTLICSGDTVLVGRGGDPRFTYSWTSNPSGYSGSGPTALVRPSATSAYYLSVTDGTTTSLDTVLVTTTSSLAPAIDISTDTTGVCQGANVVFNAVTTYGGDSAQIQWQVNGTDSGTNSNRFTSATLPDSSTVTALLTSSLSCANPRTIASNPIVLRVNPIVTPTITFIPLPGPVCLGADVKMHVTTTNGGNQPTFTWFLPSNSYTTTIDSVGFNTIDTLDRIGVTMTSNYGCASPKTASATTQVRSIPFALLSVSIVADKTKICSGDDVVFTATPVNGGNAPAYQWLIDGQNAGKDSSVFDSQSLRNGDIVSVRLTANGACVSPASATSNGVTMTIIPAATPYITLAKHGTASPGQPLTLSATIYNGGATPGFQWQDSTATTGWVDIPGATTDSISWLVPAGASAVRCELTSSLACVTEHNVVSAPLRFPGTAPNSVPGGIVHAYPNPVLTTLTLDSLQIGAGWQTIEIRNPSGQLIIPGMSIRGLSRVTVDMSSLPKGVYVVGLLRSSGDNKYFLVLKM